MKGGTAQYSSSQSTSLHVPLLPIHPFLHRVLSLSIHSSFSPPIHFSPHPFIPLCIHSSCSSPTHSPHSILSPPLDRQERSWWHQVPWGGRLSHFWPRLAHSPLGFSSGDGPLALQTFLVQHDLSLWTFCLGGLFFFSSFYFFFSPFSFF